MARSVSSQPPPQRPMPSRSCRAVARPDGHARVQVEAVDAAEPDARRPRKEGIDDASLRKAHRLGDQLGQLRLRVRGVGESRAPPLKGEDGPHEGVQRAGECLGAKGTEDPQGGRKGQHPLLDWHGLAHTTVGRYRDLLVDAMLLRSLPPVLPNVGKRLTKSPKVYVRDSGLLHALLGAETHDALLGHPVLGAVRQSSDITV